MVIFSDLSEVLVKGVGGTEDKIESLYGADYAEKFLKRRIEVNDKILDLFRNKCDENEYWKFFLQGNELSIDFTVDILRRVLSRNLRNKIPGTLDLYRSIISSPESISLDGTPSEKIIDGRPDIYIISDYIKERIGQIKDYHPDLFSIVKKEYWSCDIGYVKGDAEFFPIVLEMSNIPVEQIIFIDDIEKNIESARNNGIYAILFKNANQLKDELTECGFKFRRA